jgi:hypothetical protein
LSGLDVVTNSPTTPVTVTANIDVGPTQYYIEVFDENTGTRVGRFPYFSTEKFDFPIGANTTHNLVAFISADDTTLPPANIQASSNTITVSEQELIG